jgi:hypothetical protein
MKKIAFLLKKNKKIKERKKNRGTIMTIYIPPLNYGKQNLPFGDFVPFLAFLFSTGKERGKKRKGNKRNIFTYQW